MDSTTYLFASIFATSLGILGTILCVYSLFIIYRKISFQNYAFGCICFADISLDGLIFITAIAASVLSQINPWFSSSIYVSILLYMCISLHQATPYLAFLKSLNRFFAVVFYWKYSHIFTTKVSNALVTVAILAAFLQNLQFLNYPCNLFYNTSMISMTMRDLSSCGKEIFLRINLFTVILFSGASVLLNILTVGFLRCKSAAAKRKKLTLMEKRFLINTCATSVVYAATAVCRILMTIRTTPFLLFMLSSGCWLLFCFLNIIIFIISTSNVTYITSTKTRSIAPSSMI